MLARFRNLPLGILRDRSLAPAFIVVDQFLLFFRKMRDIRQFQLTRVSVRTKADAVDT